MILGALAALIFVGASYFIITLDRTRANSPSKDDTQVGIKLVLFGLILAGIQIAAGGVTGLLSFMLGGFKGGSLPARVTLPPIIVGAVVVIAVAKQLLPRTNADTAKQPERYLLGALAIQYGVMAIVGFDGLVSGLFLERPWASSSAGLAGTIVSGAVAFLALKRLGAHSGWKSPPAPVQPAQYPPQSGPQGGGYPPQGGGYPPQGGGYPPQGGGYPPQGGGGGYGPPGGGYPPQGGGGYPPR